MDPLDRVLIVECRYGGGFYASYLRDHETDFYLIDRGCTGGDTDWERFSWLAHLDFIPVAFGGTRAEALTNLELKCAGFTYDTYSQFHFVLQNWDVFTNNVLHRTPSEISDYLILFRQEFM